MKISDFHTNILGTNLRNARWSWGSYDPITNRVFLRVWEDEIRRVGNTERVLILRDEPRRASSGYQERRSHIELIRKGASGYGILCKAVSPRATEVRKIKSFNDSELLQLDKITRESGGIYARIIGRIPVKEIIRQRTSQCSIIEDIGEVLKEKEIDTTKKAALISARVGQGMFRSQVLELWNNRCSVTLSTTLDVIRASHIKPWRDSTDEERLDPYNGLPLVASLDALFDAGLISFKSSGALIVSSLLCDGERKIFGVNAQRLAKAPNKRTAQYLTYHREHIFRK